ncbi:MAG: class II 3-deoxy-7-phosphoheptulonate synthase [Acidimicrobiales bacterium]
MHPTATAPSVEPASAGSRWSPTSWREFPAAQQPDWPDPGALADVLGRLGALPPLVFAGEVRRLIDDLAQVADGKAFLLQAGDCAESFDWFSADSIRDKLKVILQMAAVLTYGAGVPVVKMGRIAGQFAKPRSSPTETVGGQVLPAFRGDIVNNTAPNAAARVADPTRLITAYNQSAATMNLLRAFTTGGFADLTQVHAWNAEFVAASPQGRRYEGMAAEIDRALRFMSACGIDLAAEAALHQVDFWTSHEALLLGYEEALTRQDSLTGRWYDCSAHFLWVGDRTRQIDGAHIEFLAGVGNPVGIKVGPGAEPDEVVALCRRLDPDATPGRLVIISRLGSSLVDDRLPALIKGVERAGLGVVWVCDPMHGNTYVSPSGRKTRHLDAIVSELRSFFSVHRSLGTWPGGVHLELTGEDVTECLGGSDEVTDSHLDDRYLTTCDPRLNARQSLDVAFEVASMLRGGPELQVRI